MRAKYLFLIFLVLFSLVYSYTYLGNGECLCNSCQDCRTAINADRCSLIKLTTDITYSESDLDESSCIRITKSDKTFDCQWHKIDGSNVYMDVPIRVVNYNHKIRDIHIQNCEVLEASGPANYGFGIEFRKNVEDSSIHDVKVHNCGWAGIRVAQSSNIEIYNAEIWAIASVGIRIVSGSTHVNVHNVNIKDAHYGIYLWDSDTTDNVIKDSYIKGWDYGIYFHNNLGTPSGNLFYNNIINSTTYVFYSGTPRQNSWTRDESRQNIIGGPQVGGNYYAKPNGNGYSETCEDNNRDGFCDEPLSLASNNIDYKPLTRWNPLPDVVILSPENGDRLSTYSIPVELNVRNANETNLSIFEGSFLINSTLILGEGTKHEVLYVSHDGNYTIRAVSTDGSHTAEDSVNIEVIKGLNLSVVINKPENNAIIGTPYVVVNLTVISDELNFTNISVFKNNSLINSTTSPQVGNYLVLFGLAGNGTYRIRATAYSTRGFSDYDEVNVTVVMLKCAPAPRVVITYTSEGEPVVEGEVKLIQQQPPYDSFENETNESGKAAFYNIPSGVYKVVANKPGYERQEAYITVCCEVCPIYNGTFVNIYAEEEECLGDSVWVRVVDANTSLPLFNEDVYVYEIDNPDFEPIHLITNEQGYAEYVPPKEGYYTYDTTREEVRVDTTSVILCGENKTEEVNETQEQPPSPPSPSINETEEEIKGNVTEGNITTKEEVKGRGVIEDIVVKVLTPFNMLFLAVLLAILGLIYLSRHNVVVELMNPPIVGEKATLFVYNKGDRKPLKDIVLDVYLNGKSLQVLKTNRYGKASFFIKSPGVYEVFYKGKKKLEFRVGE